jgi:hypothetical protein
VISLFTYLAAACASVFLAAAAAAWWRLSHSSDRGISTAKLRMAASATAICFALMAVALAFRVLDHFH